MMLRFALILAGTVAAPAMATGDPLANGCEANDPQCVAAVTAFLTKEAVKADQRLHAIYRAYVRALGKSEERQALKEDQATWLKTTLADCYARKDALDKWSCLGWSRDQRSRELDRRLAQALGHADREAPLTRLPINLTEHRLGLEYGGPGAYLLDTNRFKLAQNPDGDYAFSFDLVGGNEHRCSGTGKARRNGNSFTRIPDVQIDQDVFEKPEARKEQERLNAACNLEIRLFPHHVEFEGNRACNDYFACGMRAAPAGIFFLR